MVPPRQVVTFSEGRQCLGFREKMGEGRFTPGLQPRPSHTLASLDKAEPLVPRGRAVKGGGGGV